jgi:late competence protein required for DNA uptake (superfamily II DNA/RNA helicase)
MSACLNAKRVGFFIGVIKMIKGKVQCEECAKYDPGEFHYSPSYGLLCDGCYKAEMNKEDVEEDLLTVIKNISQGIDCLCEAVDEIKHNIRMG